MSDTPVDCHTGQALKHGAHVLTVTMQEDEWQAWRAKARENGMSASGYAQFVITGRRPGEPGRPKKILPSPLNNAIREMLAQTTVRAARSNDPIHRVVLGGAVQSGPAMMSMSEAGTYIGVSQGFVRGLIRDGVLPGIKLGQRVLVKKDELDSYVACLSPMAAA